MRDLFEAVPLSLVRDIIRDNPDRPYGDIFDAFSGYRRKSKDRLYFPLKSRHSHTDADLAIMNKVMDVFRNFTVGGVRTFNSIGMLAPVLCSSEDCTGTSEDRDLYLQGLVSLHGRKYRIGKVLNRIEKLHRAYIDDVESGKVKTTEHGWLVKPTPELATDLLNEFLEVKKAFQTDPIRDLRGSGLSYEIVISRHPYDIAGMSTGRGWTSCTSLVDGAERRYVATYVSTKCLVAYLIKAGDDDIKEPVSRIMIIRFENEQGDYLLVPARCQYGVSDRNFLNFVERWCKIVNRGKDDGLYCAIKGQQYATIGKAEKKGHRAYNPNTPDFSYY